MARVALRLKMGGSPSLLRFVERCLIPYLYGYSYALKHGAPPFGELAHGEVGSLQDLAGLLDIKDLGMAFRYCTLAAMKRRHANKRPCPCGNGRRLGRCHNGKVNAVRERLGRATLACEMRTIALGLREQVNHEGMGIARASCRDYVESSREDLGGQTSAPSGRVWRDRRSFVQRPTSTDPDGSREESNLMTIRPSRASFGSDGASFILPLPLHGGGR